MALAGQCGRVLEAWAEAGRRGCHNSAPLCQNLSLLSACDALTLVKAAFGRGRPPSLSSRRSLQDYRTLRAIACDRCKQLGPSPPTDFSSRRDWQLIFGRGPCWLNCLVANLQLLPEFARIVRYSLFPQFSQGRNRGSHTADAASQKSPSLVNDIYSDRSCCLTGICYRNFLSF